MHDAKTRLVTEDVFAAIPVEILKYEVRKFSVRYSKVIAEKKK